MVVGGLKAVISLCHLEGLGPYVIISCFHIQRNHRTYVYRCADGVAVLLSVVIG